MDKTDKVFDGSIPEIYDTHMVPLIFERFAAGLAGLVAGLEPAAVLETAAGSGVVTRALAPKLARSARYVVTDLNGPMLERARIRQPDDVRLSWQQADALALPFGNDTFDVVCCQFGAMFFPDRAAGFSEARRVLRPGGAFIFNTWDRIEENEFADQVTRAAAELFPDDPPLFLARTPHGYHDRDQIEADLRAGGFGAISIETVADISPAPSARHAAVAYCQGTPLRNEIEARDATALERVTDHAAARLADCFGDGAVAGRIQTHVVVARA
ncbi:methyltransferase domain-containing protein [Roseovarius sp. CAU 1744]|uniref:class I SAM-dependent methyltransferase n=1 Tax=Roseovarius sp. CAU 1744 TaxID=3140368 RepID=UPI00325A4756